MHFSDKVRKKSRNRCISGNHMPGLQKKPIALSLSLKNYFDLKFQFFVSYVYPCL